MTNPIVDPRDFLGAVAAFTRQQTDTTADRSPRIATINPAHAGGASNKPKVTFDGDTSMGQKGLPFLSSYTPTASDRVLVAPVGTTYVILGKISNP